MIQHERLATGKEIERIVFESLPAEQKREWAEAEEFLRRSRDDQYGPQQMQAVKTIIRLGGSDLDPRWLEVVDIVSAGAPEYRVVRNNAVFFNKKIRNVCPNCPGQSFDSPSTFAYWTEKLYFETRMLMFREERWMRFKAWLTTCTVCNWKSAFLEYFVPYEGYRFIPAG